MDTDSLYLALAHENLYDCVRPARKQQWEALRQQDCNESFQADAIQTFFPRTCCSKQKKHDKREPGLFKKELKCTEVICFCSKTYCCYDAQSDKYKFSSKSLNNRTLKENGDGPMEINQRLMDEIISLISTNRGFRTINNCIATYEQTKKRLSYFYPKRIVQSDGIHSAPLNIYHISLIFTIALIVCL